MTTSPIPAGHNNVSPYLVVQGATRLIQFLNHTFGAAELGRSQRSDGTIMHAELKIGDSVVMLAEATEEYGPMPCMVHVYVSDIDAVYRRAMEAGATSLREPADQPHGDRTAGVMDPCGTQWWIATHVKDVGWQRPGEG